MAISKKDGNLFDLDQAQQHLKLLGYKDSDPVYLRFFYSSSDPRKTGDAGRKLTIPALDKLHHYKRKIENYQTEGRGVYFVVNGGGHTDKEVTQALAIFCEDDKRPKEEQKTRWRDLNLPIPTCQVDTGGKSIHHYWSIEELLAIAKWRLLQANLLDYVDGDRVIKNPSRVMRLAGGWHVSYTGDPTKPFDSSRLVYNQTLIISASGQSYSYAKLSAALPMSVDGAPLYEWGNGASSSKTDKSKPAPLYCFLTKDDRSLIDSGCPEGIRNSNAHKLACNLIGTLTRLDYLGIPWCDDPYQLYLDFCRRCPGNDWNDREWEKAWRSALKSNPTASLTDDALRNCYKAWLKNQQIGEKNNGGNSKRESVGKKRNPKVVNHPKFIPLTPEEITQKIDELIGMDLPRSSLTAKLNKLASEANIPIQEVRKLYLERLVEIELTESRGEIHADLEQLREATKSQISLSSVVPTQLAHPIEKLANWLNLRPECYLTALLAGLCILNDTETELVLHRDWDFTVTPNLFAAIVSPSSQKKSPIIKAMVTKPLRALQRKAKKEYSQAKEKYEIDLARYEELKRNKDKENLESEFPNGRPVEPRMKLYYFTNATGEGIINQVAAHPNQGLLYLKDELAGVFKSANQYRGGRGSDEEDLLSYYDGTGGTVLRANGTQADLDGLLLGILGSIQPGVLQKLLGDFEDSNGNWARFIFVWQPLAPSQMNADGGKFDISSLIAWLYEEMDRTSALAPKQYALTPDAFKLFCTAYNGLEKLRVDPSSSPAMQNVWGKCEGRIGKIAIELHRIEAVFAGELPSPLINRSTIKAAIALSYFSAQQVQALYAVLDGSDSLSPMLAKVLDIAERKGDWVTAKDVRYSCSSKNRPSPDTVRQWFKELVELEMGSTTGTGRQLKFKISSKETKRNQRNQKETSVVWAQTSVNQGLQAKETKGTNFDNFFENQDDSENTEKSENLVPLVSNSQDVVTEKDTPETTVVPSWSPWSLSGSNLSNKPTDQLKVGDHVAYNDPTNISYNWHGTIVRIGKSRYTDAVGAEVRWDERKGMTGGEILFHRLEDLRLI